MKTLPTEFSKDGFNYAQVQRTDSTAIYSQSKHGRILGYEVVKIRRLPPKTLPSGTVLPEREGYPSSESWGADGFTCMTLADALKRQAQLEQECPFSGTPYPTGATFEGEGSSYACRR